jgi:GMP synthase-like glutamine amidotransferase
MRTLIIDNYLPNSPQLENLYNIIKDVTVHTVEIKDYSTINVGEVFRDYDVFIISGSQSKLAEPGIYGSYANEADFLRNTQKPTLAICFGHQLLSIAFGEKIVPMSQPIDGYYVVKRVKEDEIFEGLGEQFLMRESHKEMVENLPYDFMLLANSPNCPIEVIKHQVLPIYGVQFHPERFDDKHPAGARLLENFFKLAVWYIK